MHAKLHPRHARIIPGRSGFHLREPRRRSSPQTGPGIAGRVRLSSIRRVGEIGDRGIIKILGSGPMNIRTMAGSRTLGT